MIKTLFVDGNNLAWRVAYTHSDLTYNNQPVGVIFGFFKSILKCKRDYPLAKIVIAWDFGHARRDSESQEAVKKGVIPEFYKQNRLKSKGDAGDIIKWQMDQQWGKLKEGLSFTSCQQISKEGFEADDIVATCVLQSNENICIVSSDKDYYQLLEPGVTLYDAIKEKSMDLESFRQETGLTAPQQWIDTAALMGDAGDNIFGVPGIGEKTAIKLISEHKSLANLLGYLHAQNVATLPKKLQAILEHEPRVHLAFSLKKMDDAIEGLPEIRHKIGDGEKLFSFFNLHGFESLLTSVEKFV